MTLKSNIFTEVGADQIFAWLDCVSRADANVNPNALRDPFSAKVEILQGELLKLAARNEQLEREKREEAQMQAITEACSAIRANLASAQNNMAEDAPYDELSRLHETLLWLMAKFRHSCSFSIFNVNAETDELDKIFANRDDIIYSYEAALGVASLDEVYKKCRHYGRIFARLPLEARQFFPSGDNFEDYFAEVISLLIALGEASAKAVEAALKTAAEKSDSPLPERFFASLDLFSPAEAQKSSFLESYRQCKNFENSLARELVAMNRNLPILLALALAIFPDGCYRRLGEYYHKDGPGDPDKADGPLNQFIRNSKI